MKSFNLDHRPKIKSGFKTPENYFDLFSDNVLLQVSKKESRIVPLNIKISWGLLVAASMAFILITIPFLEHKKETLESIDPASLENYLTLNLNQSELVSLLEDQQDLKTIDFEIPILKEDLEDFLIKNDYIELYLNE